MPRKKKPAPEPEVRRPVAGRSVVSDELGDGQPIYRFYDGPEWETGKPFKLDEHGNVTEP